MTNDTPLGRFCESVKTDPLFAAEGLNLENARHQLERLKEALTNLETVLARRNFLLKLFFIRHPLRRYAVPLDFLNAFFDAEGARRDFLANPIEKNARALLRSWEKARTALLEDIRRYQFLHRVTYAIERQPPDGFQDLFGNTFTAADVDRALALLEKNAHALGDEIEGFEKVLTGENFLKERKQHSAFPSLSIGELTPQQKRLHDLVVKHTVPFRGSASIESLGPLRYTLSFLDGKPVEHLFFVQVLESRSSRERFMFPSLADEFYFMRVGGNVGRLGSVFFEPLVREGVPWWYHPPTYFYVTRDVSYLADLATLFDLHRRPHLARHLVHAQRSSLFDLLLSFCVEDIKNYIEQTALRVHKLNAPLPYQYLYALLVRSHPGLFYMPFNGSVWRLAEQPNLLGRGRVDPEKIMYRPSGEVLPTMDAETLERVFASARMRREAWLKEGIPGIRREDEF